MKYPRNFDNEYTLRWANTSEDSSYLEAHGYERISRKFAIGLCTLERRRRKISPQDSGFAWDIILPARYQGDYQYDSERDALITLDGYIYLYSND